MERLFLFLPCQFMFRILLREISFEQILIGTKVPNRWLILIFSSGFGLLAFGLAIWCRGRKPRTRYASIHLGDGKKSHGGHVRDSDTAREERVDKTALLIVGFTTAVLGIGLMLYSVGRGLPADGLDGALSIISSLVVLMIFAMVAFGVTPSCKVFVREGGHHFHQKECPYLKDVQIVPPSHAIKMGFEACPFCEASPSEPGDAVFIRKGGRHFHQEECDLLSNIQPMRKRKALAAGFVPCHRCRP